MKVVFMTSKAFAALWLPVLGYLLVDDFQAHYEGRKAFFNWEWLCKARRRQN